MKKVFAKRGLTVEENPRIAHIFYSQPKKEPLCLVTAWKLSQIQK